MNFFFRSVQFGLVHVWPVIILLFSALYLDENDLGIVAVLISLATLFRPIIGLSLGKVSIKISGQLYSRDGPNAAAAAIALATRLGLLTSMFGASIMIATLIYINKFYQLALRPSEIALVAIFIYMLALNDLLDGLFRARNDFKSLAAAAIASRCFGISALGMYLPSNPSVGALFLWLASAEALCLLLLAIKGLNYKRAKINSKNSILSSKSREMLRYSIPVVLNAISVYLYGRAMVMIIAIYDTNENTGGFELALQLTYLPMALTIILSSVLSPMIARAAAAGSRGRSSARIMISRAASFAVWINMVLAVWIFLIGPFFLLWLAPNHKASAIVILILAPLVAIRPFGQILLGETSIAIGEARKSAILTFAFSILCIFLGLLAARGWGAIGGAVALTVSHALAVATTVHVFSSKPINFSVRYRGISSLAFAAFVAAPTGFCTYLLRDSSSLVVMFGTATYLLTVFITVYFSKKYFFFMYLPIADGKRMLRKNSEYML